MTKTYSACVIGAGMGGGLSLTALAKSHRFDLLAVADTRPEALDRVKQAHPNIRTFQSHQQMFTECPTDVVCVSTYPPSHLPITLDALNHPIKGLLVEKPLSDTVADATTLMDAIKAKGLPVVTPHNLLVAPHALEIIKRVQAGEIGKLRMVEIQNSGWDIINAGIHWLNFCVNLINLEPISTVQATCDTTTRTYRDGMQVETAAVTYAVTESGIRLILNCGDQIKLSRDDTTTLFHIVGDKGMIEFVGWAPHFRIVSPAYPNGEIIETTGDGRTGHQIHLENLADMIDRGKPNYAVSDSSLMALEICEAAYTSHRHRCQIKLPLINFKPPKPNDWNPGVPYSGQGGGRDGKQFA